METKTTKTIDEKYQTGVHGELPFLASDTHQQTAMNENQANHEQCAAQSTCISVKMEERKKGIIAQKPRFESMRRLEVKGDH